MAKQRTRRLRSLRSPNARHPMTTRLALRLCAFVLLFVSPVFATRVERLIDTWCPEHFIVDLTLNDQLSEIISAKASINVLILKQTNIIDFDFGELTTDKVTLNSKPLSFTHKN